MKVGFEVETIIPLFMDVVDQGNTENERLKVPSFEKFGEVVEWHLLVSFNMSNRLVLYQAGRTQKLLCGEWGAKK